MVAAQVVNAFLSLKTFFPVLSDGSYLIFTSARIFLTCEGLEKKVDIQSIQSPLDRVEFSPRTDAQRDVVRKLEQVFIAEMLKSIDTASGENTFAGGAGEEQFKSFLNDEYAEMIVAHGGVGLSDSIMAKMPGGRGYEK